MSTPYILRLRLTSIHWFEVLRVTKFSYRYLYSPILSQEILNHRGRTIFIIPDNLFSHFIEYLPLLSPNAVIWYFSLVLLCFNAYQFSYKRLLNFLCTFYLSSRLLQLLSRKKGTFKPYAIVPWLLLKLWIIKANVLRNSCQPSTLTVI